MSALDLQNLKSNLEGLIFSKTSLFDSPVVFNSTVTLNGSQLTVQRDAQFNQGGIFNGAVSIRSDTGSARLTVGDSDGDIVFNAPVKGNGYIYNKSEVDQQITSSITTTRDLE